LTFGVARVHPEQVAGKQRGLVAAGAGANLEEDVLLVVGVLRNEQDLQLPQQHLAPGGERLQFLFGELAHLRVAALGQFLSSGNVLLEALVFTELLDERLELR
jgi:hypothetical protein